MASSRHILARFHAPWLIALSWLVACGARSQSFDWEDDGSGGSSGRGGSSAAGGQSNGSAGKGSVGKGGSNAGGSAGKGTVGGFPGKGGSPGKGDSCRYAGNGYRAGETFLSIDGCNTCTCLLGGTVRCTESPCDICTRYESEYSSMLALAKSCNPAISFNQCSTLVNGSLACSCPSYANVNQPDAIDELYYIEEQYYSSGCGGVICEPCAAPVSAFCSMDGRCIDVY